MVGGTTSGYWPTGSPMAAIPPTITMTSESTVAKTGLLIKNWLITGSSFLVVFDESLNLQEAAQYCLHGLVTYQKQRCVQCR